MTEATQATTDRTRTYDEITLFELPTGNHVFKPGAHKSRRDSHDHSKIHEAVAIVRLEQPVEKSNLVGSFPEELFPTFVCDFISGEEIDFREYDVVIPEKLSGSEKP